MCVSGSSERFTVMSEPGGIRTHDLLIRSQTLYPAELVAHIHLSQEVLSRDNVYIIALSALSVKHFFKKDRKNFSVLQSPDPVKKNILS